MFVCHSRNGGCAMKTFRALLSAAVCCFGLLGMLVLAAGASAVEPRLTLTQEGVPYAGATDSGVELGSPAGVLCVQDYQGQVDNQKPQLVDHLEGQGPQSTGCFGEGSGPGYSTTLGFTKLTLRWDGQVNVLGRSQIQIPGPCVYSFSSLAATVASPFPSLAFATGSASGWLVDKRSLLACAPTETLPLYVYVAYPLPNEEGEFRTLGAELFG